MKRAECSRSPTETPSQTTKFGGSYYTMQLGRYSNFWAGPIVYLIALLGTWLLAIESARPWAVLLLIASAVLAVVLWGRQDWTPAFASDAPARTAVNRSRLFYLLGVTIAMP
jgi:hypothetical protein